MICYSFIPKSLKRIEILFIKYKFSSPPPFVEYTVQYAYPKLTCFSRKNLSILGPHTVQCTPVPSFMSYREF